MADHDIHPPRGAGVPVKAWTRGVPLERQALEQALNVAALPCVHSHVALMPDVHFGIGATVGSVIPTVGAVIPAAVGVDIGCGMVAARTTLAAADLPDSLAPLRSAIERAVPHGVKGAGSWHADAPAAGRSAWRSLEGGLPRIAEGAPRIERAARRAPLQLGTLGGGNHFIEVCLDEAERVWVMLHSGSRGIGNAIGTHFIGLAQEDMRRHLANLPDRNLAYFEEGAKHFDDYWFAVQWAQRYAAANREVMLDRTLHALRGQVRPFRLDGRAVNCHHNYVARERHGGHDLLVTRKGAVRAGAGELGIIPGSMGARSHIVRGKGNPDAFESCSHGAGRRMSRSAAKARFSLADHAAATAGVECRKDQGVLDETPGAYKDIDAVMRAQQSLVETVHTLRQVVCCKG